MKSVVSTLLLCLLTGCAFSVDETRLSGYVNPFIGASTSMEAAGNYAGLGKTFPGATTPFGMVQVSPNTITGGDNGSGYSYEHTSIEGFAFTQMSGVGWYGDLGNFLVMPATGPLRTIAGNEDNTQEGYRSAYDKGSEKATAGYYSVFLTDYGIKTEATAAPHSGILRFTFPEHDQSRIQIDLARRVGGTSVLQYIRVENNTIRGWMKCTPDGGGWGNGMGKADYTVYFYARFSKPLDNYGFWSADIPDDWNRKLEDVGSEQYKARVAEARIIRGMNELEGKHIGFFAEFNTKKDEEITLKAGISFVDMQGAENNYREEVEDYSFDEVYERARRQWDRELGKITVSGSTSDQRVIFYTALYHTMIDPRIFSDADGRYTGGDRQIHINKKYTRRTIFSGWDVFRSQFPLQTIINPHVVNDQINSLIDLAEENASRYYDRWEFLNAYSGCMTGNPAISVLADAYVKGIRDYDIGKAYRFAANTTAKFGNGNSGYSSDAYSISNTLEYAYSDWCMSRLAEALEYKGQMEEYTARSMAYKNIFDPEKGWFRPRKPDGSWEPWPENARTREWYGCIESNPYQQGWFVPHDIQGMVELMGGKEKVIADLCHFFDQTPASLLWNDYYNHANEPVHHVPYLFNRLNVPRLTQKWTRYICDQAYRNKVEGLVGNEDAGQMSAWYILSASGIYPLCPGDTRYEITSPVFGQVDIRLAGNKKFQIIAHDNSAENIYIQHTLLNGVPYNKSYIDYQDIMAGGKLELYMGAIPPDNHQSINN